MSKPYFTAGPWAVCEDFVSVHSPSEDIIVSTHIDQPHFAPQCQRELEANAALIAAAPEMYDALFKAQIWFEGQQERLKNDLDIDYETFDAIVFALAKARGES